MFTGKKTRDARVVKRTAELYKEGKTYAEIIAGVKQECNTTINTYDVEYARDQYALAKRQTLRRPRGTGAKALRRRQERPQPALAAPGLPVPNPVTPALEQLLKRTIEQLRVLLVELNCVLLDLDRGTYRVSVNAEYEGQL